MTRYPTDFSKSDICRKIRRTTDTAGFIQQVESKTSKRFSGARNFPEAAEMKRVPFQITEIDATKHGEECPVTCCNDFSQTILLSKLLVELMDPLTGAVLLLCQ